MKLCSALSALVLCALVGYASAAPLGLPELAVPDSLGVNIHFTDPRPGEMEMLAAGGFRWVRMDFGWGGIEREKGKYDFSAFDRLVSALDRHAMRALLILDYSNRHYDGGLSPHSEEGRAAFARWAAAGARHFQGRGILWEMYNEPNIGFWKPKPDVASYVKLALAVGKALREGTPGEMYIGPGTSQIDLPFLEACFKAGLLEYWCAVSVHPYRQKVPETAAEEYARLRRLIDRYAPKGKSVPILSGEWGYSAAWKGYDPQVQGKMLPRQWLTNLANDVPLSIWYDWHDDGPDPKESEHHFGTVLHPYHAGRDPVYEPKPAYRAAKALSKALAGFRFNKRLAVGGADDYVLLFSRKDDCRLVAWTTADKPREVLIPASPGSFQAVGYLGDPREPLTADRAGLRVQLNDTPLYLSPRDPNALVRLAAAWQRAPLDLALPAQRGTLIPLELRNPLDRAITVSTPSAAPQSIPPGGTVRLSARLDLPRTDQAVELRWELEVAGMGRIAQTTPVSATNPLRLTHGPALGNRIGIRVENPSGQPFEGRVRLTELRGIEPTSLVHPIQFAQGKTEMDVSVALKAPVAKDYRLGLRIEDAGGVEQLTLAAATFRGVEDFSRHTAKSLSAAWQIVADGDHKVPSTQSISLAEAPPGLPGAEGAKVLKIEYQFGEGWKFIRLAPKEPARIEGRPQALGIWLYGDGSGTSPRLRFVDASGQTLQPSAETISWKGWRYLTLPLQGGDAGHWGGADDGTVHYPIRWDSLFLLDGTRRPIGPSAVYLAAPVLIYGDDR